jgi:hypothetical protein
MKRRATHHPRNNYDAAGARFFKHLPTDVSGSLNTRQKRAIAATIVSLQHDNPRILDELYMERPYPGRADGDWRIHERVRRRLVWRLRLFWLGLLRQKNERRSRTRAADYLFLLLMAGLLLLPLTLILLFFYVIKSHLLGIDLFETFHVFPQQ